jgi:hypothetical protein
MSGGTICESMLLIPLMHNDHNHLPPTELNPVGPQPFLRSSEFTGYAFFYYVLLHLKISVQKKKDK